MIRTYTASLNSPNRNIKIESFHTRAISSSNVSNSRFGLPESKGGNCLSKKKIERKTHTYEFQADSSAAVKLQVPFFRSRARTTVRTKELFEYFHMELIKGKKKEKYLKGNKNAERL